MKRIICALMGLSVVISFAGCGSSSTSSDSGYGTEAFYAEEAGAADSYAYDWSDYDNGTNYAVETMEDYDEEYADDYSESEESFDGIDLSEVDTKLAVSEADRTASEAAVNQEKLVYSCDISIDTLDFDASVKMLKSLREKYNGFVESESFSDGGYGISSYSYYYVEEDDKHREYHATYRIPTADYETILSDMEDVGDVRSKESYVENLTQSYTDLKVTLDVLQQTYDRYAALMENATDEEYILQIQDKLTDTQIQIAQVKSRMNTINQDVTYSTINISLREVREYTEAPAPRDTFAQRLKETVSDSMDTFLSFLEGFLFLIIMLLPFVILIGIVAVIVIALNRKFHFKEKRKAKKQLRAEENARRAAEYQEKLKANRDAKQIKSGDSSNSEKSEG